MICLSGKLICTDEQELAIVLRHLPEHIRLSRAEPGCLSFEVRQSDDPLIWLVEESFVSQEAYDAHQTRTRASAWFAASGHIRRAYNPPSQQ